MKKCYLVVWGVILAHLSGEAAVLPIMLEQGYGRIVNLTSISADAPL